MPEKYEIKPNRSAYIFSFFLKFFLISGIVISILGVLGKNYLDLSLMFPILIFIGLQVLNYWNVSVKYKKEKFIFKENKIIHLSGNIFSDKETELIIKNITHIYMKLPYLQNKFFNTGNIGVEAAGTSATEVTISAIDDPQKYYEYIKELMQFNGFSLQKKDLIQEEKPNKLGVFFEVLARFFSALITVVFVPLYIGKAELYEFLLTNFIITGSIGGLVLLGLFFRSILNFMDLKNRVYHLYDDTIVYSEGFLSKNYSFVPMENLSDSSITQTLVDKIFGLYDVKLSSQGLGHEILFKNIKNGKEFEKNLDRLIDKHDSLVPVKKEAMQKKTEKIEKKQDFKADFTKELTMDMRRTLIPRLILLPFSLVLFPFFIFWIFGFTNSIIKVVSTKYLIRKKSFEEKYSFLSSKNKEFTDEKITAIVFKENFIDNWFDTFSINFWSIGSSDHINFSNVKKQENLYENVLAKTGIREEERIYGLESDFSISELFKANIFFPALGLIILTGLAVLSFLVSILFLILAVLLLIVATALIYYYKKYYEFSKLQIYENYVYFQKGFLFKKFYYCLLDNVKDIKISRYPMSNKGSIKFNIAGEHSGAGQKKSGKAISNSFTISLVSDICQKEELIDMIFYKKPSKQEIEEINRKQEKILEARPALANSLAGLIFVSVLIFPLITFLPITLPLTVLYIRNKKYVIQEYRVYLEEGIIYRSQKSVVFTKLDHINKTQGFLNKIFSNGNIIVNTTGSRTAELTLSNIKNYEEFYEKLKEHY
ncbi:PH domain-containing protein [Candidatus Woesearchaeota archaeon]|nr:PH domain-containing protein [Candidatus Woesearchaeota archaeon]